MSGVISPMLTSAGYCVLTAESVCHLGFCIQKPKLAREMYTFDTRVVAAAKFAAEQRGPCHRVDVPTSLTHSPLDMAFIFLLSFGCGICPFTHEQCVCMRVVG